ncbi:MAG: bifunctional riboflavin kinase/FAD synthetase [Corynebacteriales bacterium]|nr:bifunctional riboflavin kinase/FAD synthetase [Mycobacteriales bacterium]
MRAWRGVENTPSDWGRSVVTIGVFDGVHRGHQQVIKHVVDTAAERGLSSVVVTFDPHPAEVVRPGSHPPMLTSAQRRADLIADLGVDGLCMLPFTVELSQFSPERFAHEVLVSHLHAATVIVGENFRFGHKAVGSVQTLAELGARFGFAAHGFPLVLDEGDAEPQIFSSTYIRACVAAGDVVAAARALGRPHMVEGVVVRGDQRGRELGFPTANLEAHPYAAMPADGIYAGWMRRAGKEYRAAISIGSNPTFAGTSRRLEAYVLDFDADIYGEHVAIEFVDRLRDMVRFDSLESLIAAIEADVALTRDLLS